MAGIRTYSSDGRCYDPLEYHRGPNTFWPFISALTALGLSNFGYQTEAEQILQGMLWGVTQFQTNIEVFLKKDGRYLKYINPDGHQHSSKDQAWTAASIYLCQKLSQQKA
jgi:glycogen debranching enzyme